MVEYGDYNGNPVIILKKDEDDKYPLTLGLGKCKKILANIEEIKQWVNEREEAIKAFEHAR